MRTTNSIWYDGISAVPSSGLRRWGRLPPEKNLWVTSFLPQPQSFLSSNWCLQFWPRWVGTQGSRWQGSHYLNKTSPELVSLLTIGAGRCLNLLGPWDLWNLWRLLRVPSLPRLHPSERFSSLVSLKMSMSKESSDTPSTLTIRLYLVALLDPLIRMERNIWPSLQQSLRV